MGGGARTSASLRMRDGRHDVQVVHGRHGCGAREPGGPAVVAIGLDEDEALANLGDADAVRVSRVDGKPCRSSADRMVQSRPSRPVRNCPAVAS